MSYTINLECLQCKHSAFEADPTYNCAGIYELALTGKTDGKGISAWEAAFGDSGAYGLCRLNGLSGQASKPILDAALERIIVQDGELRSAFKKLEPSNGWGSLQTALQHLQDMRRYAGEYPGNVWRIW